MTDGATLDDSEDTWDVGVAAGCDVRLDDDPGPPIEDFAPTNLEGCYPVLDTACAEDSDCDVLCDIGQRHCYAIGRNERHTKVKYYSEMLGPPVECHEATFVTEHDPPCLPHALVCEDCHCVGYAWGRYYGGDADTTVTCNPWPPTP